MNQVDCLRSITTLGHLVLHHLIPADDPEFGERDWRDALRDSWNGPLSVGRDGFSLMIDERATEDARA